MDIQVQDSDFLNPNKRVLIISAGPDEVTFISSEVSDDGKAVRILRHDGEVVWTRYLVQILDKIYRVTTSRNPVGYLSS